MNRDFGKVIPYSSSLYKNSTTFPATDTILVLNVYNTTSCLGIAGIIRGIGTYVALRACAATTLQYAAITLQHNISTIVSETSAWRDITRSIELCTLSGGVVKAFLCVLDRRDPCGARVMCCNEFKIFNCIPGNAVRQQ